MEISVGVLSTPGDPKQAQWHECRALLQYRVPLPSRGGKGRQRDVRLDAQGQECAPVPRHERLQRFTQQGFGTVGFKCHELVKRLVFFSVQDICYRNIEARQIFEWQREAITARVQPKVV